MYAFPGPLSGFLPRAQILILVHKMEFSFGICGRFLCQHLRWQRNQMPVIANFKPFSRCRQLDSGRLLLFPKSVFMASCHFLLNNSVPFLITATILSEPTCGNFGFQCHWNSKDVCLIKSTQSGVNHKTYFSNELYKASVE